MYMYVWIDRQIDRYTYIYIYLLYSILFEKETNKKSYCLRFLHIYFCFMPYLFQRQVVLTGHNEIHSGFDKLRNRL